MKEKIGTAIRTIAVFGVFVIALLLLTNAVNAEIPVSDGFDYPVGNRDDLSGWYTSLFLGDSWCKLDKITCYYGHLGEDYLINEGSTLVN